MAKTLQKPEFKPTHSEIAQRAYALFEKRGRVPGCDVENWLAAEAQLVAERKPEPEARPSLRPVAKPAVGQFTNSRP